jgi:hypothetical protein
MFIRMRVPLLLLVALLATTTTTTSAAWDRDPATFCVGSPYGANFSNASDSFSPTLRESCSSRLAHYASATDLQHLSEHCCTGAPGLNLDCVCGPGRAYNNTGLIQSNPSSESCNERVLQYVLKSVPPSGPEVPPRTCEAHRDAFNVSSDSGEAGAGLALVRASCCSEPPPESVSCMCPGGASNARFDAYLTKAASGKPGDVMHFSGVDWRSCPQAFDYVLTSVDTPATADSFRYVSGNATCNATVAAMTPPTCVPRDHMKDDGGACSAYNTSGTACAGGKYNGTRACAFEWTSNCEWNAGTGTCAVNAMNGHQVGQPSEV